MNQTLTPKQQLFVEEYLVDMNATRAATRAGYSAKTAYSAGQRLVRKAEISDAIQDARSERSGRVNLTIDDIVRDLVEVKDRCLQRAPVTMRGGRLEVEGDPPSSWTFNAAGATKALELLGRHLGMFSEKPDDCKNMTDKERMDALSEIFDRARVRKEAFERAAEVS
jgi:phage terminase small subunit